MNNIVEIKIRLEEIENVIAEYKNQLEDLRKHSNNEVLDKEKIDIKVESGIGTYGNVVNVPERTPKKLEDDGRMAY